MAVKWYPVIDYVACVECGTCSNFCPHGVYDKSKSPTPVVVNPDSCIDHCHGCQNRCSVGAISYVGDDAGSSAQSSCGCGCSCKATEESKKEVKIDYLYLDLKTCDRCVGTDQILEEVLALLRPALELAGYKVELLKTEMTTAELAEKYRFISSPTILVNGRDVCGEVQENACSCCGAISGMDTDCRTFSYNGSVYEVPPKEMLAEAVLREVFAPAQESARTEYRLPENLRRFYDGKETKKNVGSSCC